MNKKAVIIIVVILALCCCVVSIGLGFWYLTTQSATTGITAVQSSLKDNQRKDFLNRVNIKVNNTFSEKGYPTVMLDATSPYLVTINSDLLENVEDTSVNLKTDFCYKANANQYSLKIKYTDGSVYSVGNVETLCNL